MSNRAIKKSLDLSFPWQTQDPFLFCVHHLDFYPEGNDEMGPNATLDGRHLGNDFTIKDGWRMYHGQKVPGFPAHPHRGFETVTIVRQGFIDHSDSLGAMARFGNGDVQWMTAGKGVQHSEMFPLLKTDDNNTLELFQIWLNLPAKSKMVEPHFGMLWGETIPNIVKVDHNGLKTNINIISGKLDNETPPTPPPSSWAATEENEVAIWTIKMEANATFTLPQASKDVNRSIFFFNGDMMTLDGTIFQSHKAIELAPDAEALIENGNKESEFLLLQGKPIAEPVAQYGPFVMNNQAEIQKAIQEYQQTQFGGWPWSSYEHVHAKEKGRFAIHADGREEIK